MTSWPKQTVGKQQFWSIDHLVFGSSPWMKWSGHVLNQIIPDEVCKKGFKSFKIKIHLNLLIVGISFFVIKHCGSNLFIGRWFHILLPSFMVTTDNQVGFTNKGPKYITQGNLIGLDGKAPGFFSKYYHKKCFFGYHD